MNRPYMSATMYQLEALFETFRDDRRQLLHVFGELKKRSGADARDLASKVARRINYLAPEAEEASETAAAPLAGAATPGEMLERIRRLEAELARVQSAEEQLRRQLADLRASGVREAPRSDHARVHLADGAPGWMVAAARMAFRKQYHPDRFQDEAQRRRAHDAFVEADAVFARLLGG